MLEIRQSPDGTVSTKIIPASNATEPQSELTKNIHAIQKTAQSIIRLQEIAKKNGQLNEDEQSQYNAHMETLSQSTKTLAAIQQTNTDEETDIPRANLRFWFDKKKDKLLFGRQSEEEVEEGNEQTGNENEDTDDGVSINLPPEDASVAEAKPVGLAVAGVGGVAASKPIATAVVGPGGLAIARPVATAIAGVSPEDVMLPIFEDGFIKFPSKKKEKPAKEDKDKEDKKEKIKTDYLRGYELNFD